MAAEEPVPATAWLQWKPRGRGTAKSGRKKITLWMGNQREERGQAYSYPTTWSWKLIYDPTKSTLASQGCCLPWPMQLPLGSFLLWSHILSIPTLGPRFPPWEPLWYKTNSAEWPPGMPGFYQRDQVFPCLPSSCRSEGNIQELSILSAWRVWVKILPLAHPVTSIPFRLPRSFFINESHEHLIQSLWN